MGGADEITSEILIAAQERGKKYDRRALLLCGSLQCEFSCVFVGGIHPTPNYTHVRCHATILKIAKFQHFFLSCQCHHCSNSNIRYIVLIERSGSLWVVWTIKSAAHKLFNQIYNVCAVLLFRPPYTFLLPKKEKNVKRRIIDETSIIRETRSITLRQMLLSDGREIAWNEKFVRFLAVFIFTDIISVICYVIKQIFIGSDTLALTQCEMWVSSRYILRFLYTRVYISCTLRSTASKYLLYWRILIDMKFGKICPLPPHKIYEMEISNVFPCVVSLQAYTKHTKRFAPKKSYDDIGVGGWVRINKKLKLHFTGIAAIVIVSLLRSLPI